MAHELINDDFSRRAYSLDGPSANVLSRMIAHNTTDTDLPRHVLTGATPKRALLHCGRGSATRPQRRHLLVMVTSIRWFLLLLSMLLASPVVAGELSFTVIHLEPVQSFEPSDAFQLTLLAHTPEMNIRLNTLQGRIKRHAHPQTHHFLYLIRGQIELTVGDETKVVDAGDFITIPRGTSHAMKRIGDVEALLLDVASPPDVGDVVWYE